MAGLSQETRTTTSTPQKDTSTGTGSGSSGSSSAVSNSERSSALSTGGAEASADSGEAMSEYLAMAATTRGGFTARVMQAAGQKGNPLDHLSSGKPKDAITRASAAAVICKVAGLGKVVEGEAAVFTDVPLSHWAAPYVLRCREEGIFAGYGDNSFKPDDTITAGAATVLVNRVADPGARVKFDREAALKLADQTRKMPNAKGEGDTSKHDRTFTDDLYKKHQKSVGQADQDLSFANHKGDMALFKKNWEKHQARYEAVAAKTGVPAELIAALHWRESSANFNTYLHQGDPLGKPAVHWPTNIPVFNKWEDAAVHALGLKGKISKDLGMTSNTTDLAAMATYAEYYNGLGYHNKGKPSPYVYSGTDQYSKGKYVADGVYDPNTKDRQLGVVAMIKGISSGGGGGDGGGKSTLLEGQVKKNKEVAPDVEVKVVDSKGQSYSSKSNSNGFFSFSASLAVGNAKVSSGGASTTVKVSEGSPSWATLDLKDTASSGGGQDTPQKDTPKADTKTPASSGPKEVTHTVKSGDTLYDLAQKYLGDGSRYMEIFNANRDKLSSPSALAVGQVLKIPSSSKSTGSSGGGSDKAPTTTTVTHTVKSGDTLSGIASKYYGDSSRWSEIFAANRDKLSNANSLSVGQAIKVPNVKTGGGSGTTTTTTPTPAPKPDTTPSKPTKPSGNKTLTETRGEAAAKSAHIAYVEGRKIHGDGSWETQGSNQGPMVNQFKAANNAGGKNEYEWCGMFVGAQYAKAGIRKEILKNLVFWSGYRLNQFFSAGKYVGGAGKAGNWWQPHKTKQLGSTTGSKRKDMLKDFSPQAGDIVLFRADYSHVAMVTSYDEKTGTMEIMEGNRSNKVQATEYGTGDNQITFIGRFNDSDFEPGGSVDPALEKANEPAVTHKNAGAGSTS